MLLTKSDTQPTERRGDYEVRRCSVSVPDQRLPTKSFRPRASDQELPTKSFLTRYRTFGMKLFPFEASTESTKMRDQEVP